MHDDNYISFAMSPGTCYHDHLLQFAVADLEIFRGGFRFKKTPAKIEMKTKKKKKKKKRSSLAF